MGKLINDYSTMLLRKNTKPFKTIQHIVKECERKADREKLIRLYITRAGQSIQERISVEAIQGDADVFYNMGFETVLSNLDSTTHQLHVSDDIPGIYFFRSNLSKSWDECPFEFDEAIQKEFKSLPALPVTRKKEKSEKFVLPAPNLKSEKPSDKKSRVAPKKLVKKEEKKVKESRQPKFKVKQKLLFTNLDTVIFKQSKTSKEEVLNYYDKISEYILPHLKDRCLSVRLYDDAFRKSRPLTTAVFLDHGLEEIPDWIRTSRESIDGEQMIIVNDKEHLLACVELGCIEFLPHLSRIKNQDRPDYVIIAIESPEYDIAKAVEGTRVARQVLSGLKLPSFVKTDGKSVLHIYIPLDSKGNFDTTIALAQYICKLINLKLPDFVALEGASDYTYGKVTLNFSLNRRDTGIIAPYSLVLGETDALATPLFWEELDGELIVDAFKSSAIFTRLKDVGDPFEKLNKKVNADEVLSRLIENYDFLL